MTLDRGWIYKRYEISSLTTEFVEGATAQPTYMDGTNVKCPCTKCKIKAFHSPYIVMLHLLKNDVPNNQVMGMHSEKQVSSQDAFNMVDRDEIGMRSWS